MIDIGRDAQRIQDYVVGRLSDDEQRAFEDRLQSDPRLASYLEQSLRLREGLEQLREQGELLRTAPLTSALRIWRPLLIAAALVGVALLLRTQLNPVTVPVLRASIESPSGAAAPAVTALFTFVATRGSSTPDLGLPAAGAIELRAAPGTRSTTYRVTLTRSGPGPVTSAGTVAGVGLSADGYVHTYADATRLTPGDYELRVEPETPATGGAAETFAFNLRARANP